MRDLSSTKTNKEIQPPEWPDQIVPNDLIPAKAGLNRLVWDLRMNDPAQIPGAFYEGDPPRGPLVAPGRYELRLSLNGVTRTAPLTVIADPRVPGSEAAIAAKTALAVATVADIDVLHRAVNEVRAARKVIAASSDKALDPQLADIEEALMQVNMKGSEADLAFPGMLNEQYASFAGVLDGRHRPNRSGGGDVQPAACPAGGPARRLEQAQGRPAGQSQGGGGEVFAGPRAAPEPSRSLIFSPAALGRKPRARAGVVSRARPPCPEGGGRAPWS